MDFSEYLDQHIDRIPRLVSFDSYNEFKEDSNYCFELFALRSFVESKNYELKSVDSHIENIQDWLTYIEKRAHDTTNQILRARYNDLLWTHRVDSKSILTNGNVADKCKLAIDDYIALSRDKLLKREDDADLLVKLRDYLFRAWKLAKQIRSREHQEIIAELMIDIENSINSNQQIGLWGFSYVKLIKDTSVELTEQNEQKIIEKLIERISKLDATNYNALEYGVKKLLDYYKEDEEKKLEFLSILERNASIPSKVPFANQNRYEQIIELCEKYDMKDLKEQAIKRYQHCGKASKENMFKIEHEFTITTEMKDSLINALYHENKTIHINRISTNFIFNKDKIKTIQQNNESQLYFREVFQTAIINDEGVTIKTIEDEADDKLFLTCYEAWKFKFIFLAIALEDYQRKHQLFASEWYALLYSDLLYGGNNKTFQTLIQAFIKKEFTVMIHIAIPLIEKGLRQLLFLCDRSIYEQNKHDGFENVTLTRIIETLEDYLDVNIIFHLKFVLNEKAGLNLRNRLSHGLMKDAEFNELTALTIFHVLIVMKYLVGFQNN